MNKLFLKQILSNTGEKEDQITTFVLLCLGIIESVEKDIISSQNAIQSFFHAENCLFIHNEFQVKLANEIMSHGVQLQDIWDSLSNDAANQEFKNELNKIHQLCLELMDNKKIAA